MSGESKLAQRLVAEAMEEAEAAANMDGDTLGRAIINAVIEHNLRHRQLDDVKQELQYTLDNLDQDEFVITRGC